MTKKLTTEEFIERARTTHGNLFIYEKANYIDSCTKIEIICSKHGSFWQTPASHIFGSGCSACANLRQLTNNEFIQRAKVIHGEKYDYSESAYFNKSSKVIIKCSEHGNFSQTAIVHLSGKGCPKCKSSHGERIIRNFLVNNNIEFAEQYRHPDCRDKKPLPFDFYLPSYNLLIEFQGEQHFRFASVFHKAYANFEITQKHDNIKKQWALNNNVHLLEINYKQMNVIDNILTNELKDSRNKSKVQNLY